MQPITLVHSAADAIANIEKFNAAMAPEADFRLVKLLPHVQAWYAIEDEDGFRFGPSKFIGYRDMTVDLYAEETGATGRLDGRVTEKKLSGWATAITEDDERFEELHTALAKFCAEHGTFPNKRARISILETQKSEVSEMEKVKALSVLIASLSTEGKRELKRLAFA